MFKKRKKRVSDIICLYNMGLDDISPANIQNTPSTCLIKTDFICWGFICLYVFSFAAVIRLQLLNVEC